MTKEELLAKGLTEEQAKFVISSLESYVDKARLDDAYKERDALKKALGERDTQLEELKKSSGDNVALQQQIAELQKQNAEQQKAHETEMKSLKISNAVDLALTNARAKNNTAVRALLADFIAKAEIAEDGTVKGLDAEVKKLAEGKETSFLFDKIREKVFRGAKPAEKSDTAGDPAEMTLEKFRAMPPMDRHAFSVSHPEEYKNLYGGRS